MFFDRNLAIIACFFRAAPNQWAWVSTTVRPRWDGWRLSRATGRPVRKTLRHEEIWDKKERGRAEYGNRTRLPGLGSPCTTDVLIPHALSREIGVAFYKGFLHLPFLLGTKSRYPDSNRGPTHYECVALPTEPYRHFASAKILFFF